MLFNPIDQSAEESFQILTIPLFIIFAFMVCGPIVAKAQIPESAIEPQVLVDRAINSQNAAIFSLWQKVQPVLAYQIPENIEDVPRVIRENLGTIDQINKYQPEDQKYENLDDFFWRNNGQFLNLAISDGKLDIYHIGNWKTHYSSIPVEFLFSTNKDLIYQLSQFDGFASILKVSNPALAAGIKTNPVPLVRLSDLGFPLEDEVILDKSGDWGPNAVQIAKAGVDAYVNFEISRDESKKIKSITAYLINPEASLLPDGSLEMRPINYVPTAEAAQMGNQTELSSPQGASCQATLSNDSTRRGLVPQSEPAITFAQIQSGNL